MRKYGTLGLIIITIVAALGVSAAIQQQWAESLVLAFIALLGTAVLVLVCSRYIARLLRTQERKERRARVRDKERLDDFRKQFSESQERFEGTQRRFEKLFLDQQKQTEEVHISVKSFETEFTALKAELTALDTKIQRLANTNKRHFTQAIRHSTTEIEALLQIYSHFSELKLPMPEAGGWAIDARSLAHLISLVQEKRPRRILELGSGTSSIWLGYLCSTYGGQVVTLDHLVEYLEQTRAAVARHELQDYVESRLAPLEWIACDGEDFQWYAHEAINDLSDIDMLIVDGPPAATGPKARYPALPETFELLTQNSTIVLDDAHRPDEVNIINQWQSRFPEFKRVVLDTPRLAVLTRNAE